MLGSVEVIAAPAPLAIEWLDRAVALDFTNFAGQQPGAGGGPHPRHGARHVTARRVSSPSSPSRRCPTRSSHPPPPRRDGGVEPEQSRRGDGYYQWAADWRERGTTIIFGVANALQGDRMVTVRQRAARLVFTRQRFAREPAWHSGPADRRAWMAKTPGELFGRVFARDSVPSFSAGNLTGAPTPSNSQVFGVLECHASFHS